MTNLLTVLPDFDIKPYTHILPSLEKALISTADLLTLDALDVAKRAQVPPAEVKKLTSVLLNELHTIESDDNTGDGKLSPRCLAPREGTIISTLDNGLDSALGGGITTGQLTEIVGESAAGKTQILLTLLLSVQLSSINSKGKTALYISTEAPLQTLRLSQILDVHPKLSGLLPHEKPSLSRIQSTHIHDLEAQDHILHYQVPIVIERHDVGLLVVDSIAANYRTEFDRGKARRSAAESFVKRSNQVARLGALLREIAQTHNIAVVVANQVSDRFAPVEQSSQVTTSQQTQRSLPTSPPRTTSTAKGPHSQTVPSEPPTTLVSTDDPLALDHQQRFFTGWGDETAVTSLKTPSLGLAWANQIATRIALLKEPIYEQRQYKPGEDMSISGWKRTLRVVFSASCAESTIEFAIVEGGIRSIVEPHQEAK